MRQDHQVEANPKPRPSSPCGCSPPRTKDNNLSANCEKAIEESFLFLSAFLFFFHCSSSHDHAHQELSLYHFIA
jgi:hypothetical protein